MKIRSLFRWRVFVPLMLLAVAVSVLPIVTNTWAAGNSAHAGSHVSVSPLRKHFKFLQAGIQPPNYYQCIKLIGFPC